MRLSLTRDVGTDDAHPDALEGLAFGGEPPVGVESRRARKKSATRHALEEAALRLVGDRGLAQVTVDDIAEAADVSPRTFFNYFPSKDAAVTGYDPGRCAHLVDLLAGRPANEAPLDSLVAVMVQMNSEFVDDARDPSAQRSLWVRRLGVIKSDPHLLAGFVANNMAIERELTLVLARRLGVDPATDCYPGLVVATTMTASRIAAMTWATGDGSSSLVSLTVEALRQLAGGLRNPKPAPARPERATSRPAGVAGRRPGRMKGSS